MTPFCQKFGVATTASQHTSNGWEWGGQDGCVKMNVWRQLKVLYLGFCHTVVIGVIRGIRLHGVERPRERDILETAENTSSRWFSSKDGEGWRNALHFTPCISLRQGSGIVLIAVR